MKKLLFTFCLWLAAGSCLAALHIHTDASDYRVGDRIWFRVHELSNADDVMFVELINPQGTVTKRIKLLRMDGYFAGYMDVPTSCEAGQYLVRAYTRSMMPDISGDGKQIIYIHGPLGDNSAQSAGPQTRYAANDSSLFAQVTMPLSVSEQVASPTLHIDTTRLLPGERVYLSLSVTDRYAISRHPQWTILQTMNKDSAGSQAVSGDCVRGKVLTPVRRKPVEGAIVNMIVPGTYFYASDTTDKDGSFNFADELVPEGTTVLVSAMTMDGRQNVVVQIEEEDFPEYNGITPAEICMTEQGQTIPPAVLNDITDSVLLDEIEVYAKRTYESKREQHSMYVADASFGMSKIEEYNATCLHDLLRRVPGVRVVNDQCFIRGAHSIYAENPAAIAINGVIQEDSYDLDLIPMQDIARLDVFKSGTTVIWGSRGGAGVISIMLKDGADIPKQTNQSNLKRVNPLGWQQPTAFVVTIPQSGYPATVMWEEAVRAADIQLPSLLDNHYYDVVMEGVTSKGRLVHETLTIDVRLTD